MDKKVWKCVHCTTVNTAPASTILLQCEACDRLHLGEYFEAAGDDEAGQ